MKTSAASIVPYSVPTALAASDVGTWQCSLATGLMHCDAIMAGMLGFSEEAGRDGIPLVSVRERIHPADRHVFERKNEAVAEHGGAIVIEYRVAPRLGVVRWLLVRGRYERHRTIDNDNGCVGHGIAIDITDTKADGHLPGGTFFAVAADHETEDHPLTRTADLALALHREVEGIERFVPGLRETVEMTLHLVARALARKLRA